MIGIKPLHQNLHVSVETIDNVDTVGSFDVEHVESDSTAREYVTLVKDDIIPVDHNIETIKLSNPTQSSCVISRLHSDNCNSVMVGFYFEVRYLVLWANIPIYGHRTHTRLPNQIRRFFYLSPRAIPVKLFETEIS